MGRYAGLPATIEPENLELWANDVDANAMKIADANAAYLSRKGLVYDVTHADYGAVADDTTNSSAAIQAALTAAAGGICWVPEGNYRAANLSVPADTTLLLHPNARIKLPDSSATSADVIQMHDADGAQVVGGIIDGNAGNHGTRNEQRDGISIRGTSRFLVDGTRISNCEGDGIFINRSLDAGLADYSSGVISRPVITACERNGISLISARDLTVAAPIITGSGLNAIDVEPSDRTRDIIQGVHITDPVIDGSGITAGGSYTTGNGVLVYLLQLGNLEAVDLIIDRPLIHDTPGVGIRVGAWTQTAALAGSVTVNSPRIIDGQQEGLVIRDTTVGVQVTCNDVYVRNVCQNATPYLFREAVIVYSGNTLDTETLEPGDINIVGLDIVMPGTFNRFLRIASDSTTYGHKRTSVSDARFEGTPAVSDTSMNALDYTTARIEMRRSSPAVTKTANYTVERGVSMVLADATSADVYVTTPDARLWNGRVVTVKKIDSSVNDVYLARGSASYAIDGAGQQTVATAQYEFMTIVSDGADWHITAT